MYNKLVKVGFAGVIAQAESEEDKEVVIYGLEAIVANVVNLMVMFFIGYIGQNVLATLIFLLCLNCIRIFAGGYHANTYLTCLLCSIVTYSLILVINPYVTLDYNAILIGGVIISSIVILAIAPVLNGKRYFSEKEIQKTRKKVRIILAAELITMVVLYQINFELYKFAVYAVITEGVFGMMGKIKYKEFNKQAIMKKIMKVSMGAAIIASGIPCVGIFYENKIPQSLKKELEER